MNIRYLIAHAASIFLALGLLVAPAQAQEEKPFAEHQFVLQLSDNTADKQKLVLSVASNILKHYGPDLVEVEIVAFGAGLELLFKNNTNSDRIQGLVDSGGVRFSACGNTLSTLRKKLGHDIELNKNAKVVPVAVVRIKELVDEGYFLMRP